MSRPAMPGRPLTMTEELEKLEQSITLTLQEIDSNFSKAHRIVTNNILPIVEQYGENSKAVWEASTFWKQFFEASANVSLSGYDDNEDETRQQSVEEESSAMRDITDANMTHDDHDRINNEVHGDDDTVTYQQQHQQGTRTQQHTEQDTHFHQYSEESMLDDPDGDLSGSTPRAPATRTIKSQYSDFQSPYSVQSNSRIDEEVTQLLSDDEEPPATRRGAAIVDEDDTSLLFNQRTAQLPNISLTPQPKVPPSLSAKDKGKESAMRHHVLKKNFRLPTTPHRFVARMQSPAKHCTSGTASRHRAANQPASERKPWEDSPESSPEMAIPRMRSEAFMSPMRTNNIRQKLEAVPSASGPRTPGVSIIAPRQQQYQSRQYQDYSDAAGPSAAYEYDPFTVEKSERALPKEKYEIDWESDSDDALGVSPPKTIQFALAPAKLIQTPAREASKRIVEDILATAGADKGGDMSPTMVKMREDLLDDSF
ncbi:DASH complex subunit ask1 [Ceratocystis fimbriata CBS 114723]|uniref:DASH complex subunit ASK1 n=1 Tax=Ceratocystis fimbriata CBS 114723 TaxID=1035309 RepID=A0A2C5X5F2_9PEZI|nr:DASH complex subunit ask1 [Ceratocystis fimbriata CBS 114723]